MRMTGPALSCKLKVMETVQFGLSKSELILLAVAFVLSIPMFFLFNLVRKEIMRDRKIQKELDAAESLKMSEKNVLPDLRN